MRRALWWALGVSVALSVWAKLSPSPSPSPSSGAGVGLPTARTAGLQAGDAGVSAAQAVLAAASGPVVLPARWPVPDVAAATRNPFLPLPPPAPKPVAPPVVAAPPPPPPPVSDYRFWGRFAGPDGQPLVFVTRGAGNPTQVRAGTRLENGWAVEAIGDNAVVLSHAESQQRTTLAIPVEPPPVEPAAGVH